MTKNKKHLYYLNELSDYKIADGYSDVRGWDVKDFNNRVIGKVDNLLVNQDAERVVYLDVEVDQSIIDEKHDPYSHSSNDNIKEFVNKDGENHIILPIGLVDLNENSNYVYTEIVDYKTFAETKRIRRGEIIDRDYERYVLSSYGRNLKSYNTPMVSGDNKNKGKIDISIENQLRQIVRDEIRMYHNEYSNENKDLMVDTVDGRVTYSEDISDDDFYERSEFDDARLRK